MEHTPPVPPVPDLDGDSFQRIWQRVMPEEKPDCPIEAVHSRPPAQQLLPTPELPPEESAEDSAPSAPTDRLGRDDFPGEESLCLGKGAAGQGLPLQGHILTELEGWQLYRHLARRVSGANARALTALASEKHGHARRLAAAYFLISGVRYWPTDRLESPPIGGWLATLRARFSAEQRQEQRLRSAACDTRDPCLRTLYREVADGCAAHAALIRTMIEGSM